MTEVSEAVHSQGKKMTFFGAVVIFLGVLALLAPGITGFSVAAMVGILVIIAGIMRMIWAFQADGLGKGILVFAIGGLTLLCGLALATDPIFASGVLTLMLAGYFFVDGIFETVAAFQMKPESGWGFMLFGGIISILLGVMIWRQFPLSGAWAIGTLVGIKLFFIGMMMVSGGSLVREASKPA